jgi:hypothetical protein
MTREELVARVVRAIVIRLPHEITIACVFNHMDLDLGKMGGELRDEAIVTANGIQRWPIA